MIKSHKTPVTQIKNTLSFADIKKIATNQQALLKAFFLTTEEALSMREIEQRTGIEVYNLCRRIAELKKSGFLEVAYVGESKVSGFPAVNHYRRKVK